MAKGVSRREFMQFAVGGVTMLGLSACSTGASSSNKSGASSSNKSDDKNPFSLVGAFHPATGMTQPSGTKEQVQKGMANLTQSESANDKKTIFVFAKVVPDDKKNLKVGIIKGNMRGGTVSAATLTVDKTNEYGDNYGLNRRDYFETLTQLGYHDGASGNELMAGSDSDYRVVFIFFVGKNDLEKGKSAQLEWGDFSLSFDMKDVRSVESPNNMIAELQKQ